MKNISKVALVAVFALVLTVCSFNVALTSHAESGGGSSSASQDEKDDRPSDNDDNPGSNSGIGGDTSTATTSISDAARKWANEHGFNLGLIENYAAPNAHQPSDSDIEAFKNWMNGGSNPRNQVMKQITELAGEQVANELWNYCNTLWKKLMNHANVGSVVSETSGLKNVGAMQEGMFAGVFGALISQDTNNSQGNQSTSSSNYALALTLFTDGFVVSSDDVTYRLHNINDGKTVYEMPAPKQVAVSEDQFPAGVTSFTSLFPLEVQEVSQQDIAYLKQYAIDIASSSENASDVNADRDVYEAVAKYINTEFGNYFGQCPGPTVAKGIEALGISLDSSTEDKVGSSVGERDFVNSFFGVSSATANIWRDGFLPSFDGTTYRLHSGKDGTVVFAATLDELNAIDNSFPTQFIVVGVIAVLIIIGLVFVVVRRRGLMSQN